MTQPSNDDLQKCVEHIYWDLIDMHGIPKGRKNELTFVTGLIIQMADVMDLRMQDIAVMLKVSKSTVTDYVDYLEKRGYVDRERGLKDRRDVFIVPTEKGRKWVERSKAINIRYAEAGMNRLTSREQKIFLKLLVKFIGDIDEPPYSVMLNGRDGGEAG